MSLYIRVARVSRRNARDSYYPKVSYGFWHKVSGAYLLPTKEYEALCGKKLPDPIESLDSNRIPAKMCSQCEKVIS